MSLTRRIGISLVLCLGLVALFSSPSGAMPGGKITEVTVSPDLRRVTVKSDGLVGPHTASIGENPSRLIIDVERADITKNLQVNGVSGPSGLAVRVAKQRSGARVILDFGTSSLPAHKIRRLGNYLLVFLQEWEPKPAAAAQMIREKASSPAPPAPAVHRKTEKPHHGSSPQVSIKSAEVVDGLVVLNLASRANPGVTYRIDLGVDFEKLGFSTARISSSDSKTPQPIKVSSRRSPFWTEEPTLRVGPRKSPPSSVTVQENEIKVGRTAKLSSRPW